MTEKLGVLLVDMPEPMFWKYTYIDNVEKMWFAGNCDSMNEINDRIDYVFKCTQEEAKECFPQFRWVSLEEL